MGWQRMEHRPSYRRSPANRDSSLNCLAPSAETESKYLVHYSRFRSLWGTPARDMNGSIAVH